MIIADPVTACHDECPIQEILSGEQGESGAPQDRQLEDPAVAPSGDGDAAADDAKRAAPAPHYRPAYELADAAHERLGRGTQPPVLNA